MDASFGPGALDRALHDDHAPRRIGHIPFTPRAKRALERSLHEALERRDDHIGPEHLLLGLLREERGVAVLALRRTGVSPDRVRAGLDPAAASRRGHGA